MELSEYSDLPMPELKSIKHTYFREIKSDEIIFDIPHGADDRRIMPIGL